MHFDGGQIQAHGLDPNAHQLLALELFKDHLQHAVLGPAVHAGVDGVPRTKTLGQSAPLAALLGDIEQRIEKLQMADPYVTALTGKTGRNTLVLLLGDPHERSLAYFSVNTP